MYKNKTVKFNDWYMKKDPPMRMVVDFECINVLLESTIKNDVRNVNCMQSLHNDFMGQLFVSKPVAIGYNIVKNPHYDNRNLEQDGCIKSIAEDCVEWFTNEMLEL